MEEIGVPFIWTSGHKCDNSVDPKYVLVEVRFILYIMYSFKSLKYKLVPISSSLKSHYRNCFYNHCFNCDILNK